MRDIVFVAISVAFFAIAALYVRACARLLGPDELVALDSSELDELDAGAVASGAEPVAS